MANKLPSNGPSNPGSGGEAGGTNPQIPAAEKLRAADPENPLFGRAVHSLDRTARANEEQVTYPSIDLSRAYQDGGPSAAGGGTTGGLSLLAQDTIRQALGWRYRSGDVKGFSAAINRAFTLTQDQDGVVDWQWTPQTYAIQADLGEITGAQASIFEQAKVTINFMLPLLDGLQPLRADSDEEDIKALTGIVRMKLNSMLAELGRVGGPRVQRLDLLHEELLGRPIMEAVTPPGGGPKQWVEVSISDMCAWKEQLDALDNPPPSSPERGGYTPDLPPAKTRAYSLLRQLGQELGVAPELANSVEEERDLTNYMIIIDSAIALRTSWIGKRKFFNRFTDSQSFLGTQLVWLSRQIEVVAETVRSAYAAMDSVFFGPQERQATDIFFDTQAGDSGEAAKITQHQAAITVGDLLDWVETFATQEGPQLLQESGKDGVLSFRATVKRLEEWVEAARIFSEKGPGSHHAPRSFFTVRVSRALREIELQLDAAAGRTLGISRSTRFNDSDYTKIADLPKPSTSLVRDIGYLNGQNLTNSPAQ